MGTWKLATGPLTSAGLPLTGVAVTCTVDEFRTLKEISMLAVVGCGSPLYRLN
jgi:hypothetical protein